MVHLDFPPSRTHCQAGFTLIEMAVVVVIIGILMAAGLKVATVQREAASYSATRTKQEAIKQALINYLRNKKQLPCPDSRVGWGNDGAVFAIGSAPDGIENRNKVQGADLVPDTAQNCDARFGVLPWVTLGLPRDAVIDGFGNFFTYHVKASVVLGAADDWNITTSSSFDSALQQGGIILQQRNDNALNPTPAFPLPATFIFSVVAVVSHGSNGLGAWTVKGSRNVMPVAAVAPDENENANGEVDADGDGVLDAVYIQRNVNNDPNANGGAFDDVVMALAPDDLLAPLLKEGTFKPTDVSLNEIFTSIKDAIVGATIGGYVSASNYYVVPSAIPAGITTTDPWGTAIAITYGSELGDGADGIPGNADDYQISNTYPTNLQVAPPNNPTIAFTLTSAGPDKVAGNADDRPYSITISALRGILAKTGF